MTTVHAALGEPPWLSIVPRDRHSWRAREHFLIFSLPLHLRTWRLRSWRTLWCFLHWEEPPHQEPSWASLCCDTTLLTLSDTLEVALKGDSSSGFFSWNVRYLKDLHTSTNLSSKAVIQRHLTTQRICFLQETHWTANDIVNWGSAFPFSTICATPGRSNRRARETKAVLPLFSRPDLPSLAHGSWLSGSPSKPRFGGPTRSISVLVGPCTSHPRNASTRLTLFLQITSTGLSRRSGHISTQTAPRRDLRRKRQSLTAGQRCFIE